MFSDLNLTYQPNDDPFILTTDFTWEPRGTGFKYIVRAGSSTDLASIPWGMRNIFNRLGASVRAAIIHDDMYRREFETRKKCDEWFYRALLECGMSRWKAKIYYRGVRIGGRTRGDW